MCDIHNCIPLARARDTIDMQFIHVRIVIIRRALKLKRENRNFIFRSLVGIRTDTTIM